MYTGTLEPIARGDAYVETLEITDDAGAPIVAAVLSSCSWTVRIRAMSGPEVRADAVAVAGDGVIRWTFTPAQTAVLAPGPHTITVDATDDQGARTRILDATLPISQD